MIIISIVLWSIALGLLIGFSIFYFRLTRKKVGTLTLVTHDSDPQRGTDILLELDDDTSINRILSSKMVMLRVDVIIL